jgi:hypothetical protein
MMCLSNMVFRSFILHMASSLSTAISMSVLLCTYTSCTKHEKTCMATSFLTSYPAILTCPLSQLLFCFHQVTKNILEDSKMMNKQELTEY